MTTGGTNVVLGFATGYEWNELRPFVESLQATGFEGELRLFSARTSPRTAQILAERSVTLQHAPAWRLPLHPYNKRLRALWPSYPRLARALSLAAHDRYRARVRLAAAILPTFAARYVRYQAFLASEQSRYASVMLTDTRDVFFQRDPFDSQIGDRLNCFLEAAPHTIVSDDTPFRRWIRAAAGDQGLAQLATRPASCPGVIIGSYEAVMTYLDVMVDWLTRLILDPWVAPDGSVHNYIIHSGLVPNVRLVPNGSGAVLTMALMKGVTPETLHDGAGRPINVLHQYDRHPHIQRLLLDRLN